MDWVGVGGPRAPSRTLFLECIDFSCQRATSAGRLTHGSDTLSFELRFVYRILEFEVVRQVIERLAEVGIVRVELLGEHFPALAEQLRGGLLADGDLFEVASARGHVVRISLLERVEVAEDGVGKTSGGSDNPGRRENEQEGEWGGQTDDHSLFERGAYSSLRL